MKYKRDIRPRTRKLAIAMEQRYEVTGPLHVICKCDSCKGVRGMSDIQKTESLQWLAAYAKLERELATAIEQRDKAIEALKEIRERRTPSIYASKWEFGK